MKKTIVTHTQQEWKASNTKQSKGTSQEVTFFKIHSSTCQLLNWQRVKKTNKTCTHKQL